MEERKIATVLFADFVGSTVVGTEHDPEVVRATFRTVFERMRVILVAHGGTVEKFIGDAVMAVFGVPVAHEDDALRAVRAAFALRDDVAGSSGSPITIGLRVGISTGEVVAGLPGRRDLLVTGPTVNMGARLQSAGEPGQIVVDALTRRLTAGQVVYGPELHVSAKNLGNVSAWPASGLVPAPDAGRVGAGPFVGRDAEIQVLLDASDRVRRQRTPVLVTVYGTPGVGKSRLAAEVVERARLSPVRYGRCAAYGDAAAFAPVRSILRADIGLTDQQDAASAADAVRAAVHATSAGDAEEAENIARRLQVLAGVADAASVLPDVPRESLAQELDWGLLRYLEQRSEHGLLTLVFEDVHWADPALLDTIEHLAEWTRGPLLIICLARPEFFDHRPSWGGARPDAITLALRPLKADETRDLVTRLVPAEHAAAIEAITQRAEGNPLYAEEIVRLLLEGGDVAAVPATLHGIIAARLDAADPAVKALLQRASVGGRVFWTDALGELGEDRVTMRAGLVDAMRRDFIVDLRTRGPSGGWAYRFTHALTREVAYASLAKSERCRLHDLSSRWLERMAGERRVEELPTIAFHAERAYLLAVEVGVEGSADLGRRAFTLLFEAARAEQARDDYRASRSLWVRAADVGAAVGVDPVLLMEANGRAAITRLRLESSREALAEVEAILPTARRFGPSAVLAALLQWDAMYGSYTDGVDPAQLHEEAVRVAREVGDTSLMAAVLRGSAGPAGAAGDLDRERAILREAREVLAASEDRLQLPRVILELARNAIARGEFTVARGLLDEGRALVRDVVGRVLAHRIEAVFARAVGRLDDARTSAESALAAASELGSPSAIAYAAVVAGGVLRELGQAERSREILEDALFKARGRTPGAAVAGLRCELVRTQLALGALEAARIQADEIASAPIPDVSTRSLARCARGLLVAAEGDAERASALLRDALAFLEPTGLALERALCQIELGERLIAAGRGADARALLERARDFYADPLAGGRRGEVEALIRALG